MAVNPTSPSQAQETAPSARTRRAFRATASALLPWLALVLISGAFGALSVIAWFYFTLPPTPAAPTSRVASATESATATPATASEAAAPIALAASSDNASHAAMAAAVNNAQAGSPRDVERIRAAERPAKSGADLAARPPVSSSLKAQATPEDPGLAAVLKSLADRPNASGVVVVVVSSPRAQ